MPEERKWNPVIRIYVYMYVTQMLKYRLCGGSLDQIAIIVWASNKHELVK